MMVQVTKSERELQQEGQSRERDMRRSGERGGRGGWAYLTDSFMREHGADGQSGLVCVWETSWWSKRARVWQWIQRAVLLFKSLILSCSLSLSLSLSLYALPLFNLSFFLFYLRYFCDSHRGSPSSCLCSFSFRNSHHTSTLSHLVLSKPIFPQFSNGCYYLKVKLYVVPHHLPWFISVY